MSRELFVLNSDGTVHVVGLDSRPTFEAVKALIPGCDTMEHVAVLYRNKAASLYVDEDGCSKGLQANHRASRIYSNAMLWRAGLATYDEVTSTAPVGYVSVDGRPLLIVGTAVLWTGPRI